MDKIRILAVVLCLIPFGCGSGPDNNPADPDNLSGDNQTGVEPTPTPDPTTDNSTYQPDNNTVIPAPTPIIHSGPEPVATFTIKKSALKATFDASAVSSATYIKDSLSVRWDWTNDGTYDTNWTTTKTTSHTYPADGTYTVAMQVKDPQDRVDTATKLFTINKTNTSPTAAFNVTMVQGMIASVDASSSSDAEDLPEDLRVRWDWNNDGTYDTDWVNVKTAQHTYTTAGEYTIKLQVKDLNDAAKTATTDIVASPVIIRNGFITYGNPYMIGMHFRMINNVTGQNVTPTDVPALSRGDFVISEDGVPIDLSETNVILNSGRRPMYVVLVLDFTGSMHDSNGIAPMISAAKAFIDSQSTNMYISLWAFWERQGGNGEIDDFTRCTPDGQAKLKADLDTFAAGSRDRGATEIWDLLKKLVDIKFPAYDTGINRGILFLTDGHDTTSSASATSLISAAQKKALFMYSIGLAFRSQDYPKDEANLKKIADETGGLYFTVNQTSDLATIFTQLSENINADWTLSYITLKSTGTHTLKTVCSYLNGYTTLTGKFPVTDGVKGDIKKALLLAVPAQDNPLGKTEYAVYAGYIPRNISTIKIKITSADPARITLYDNNTLCSPSAGWTISPDVNAGQPVPADGWYTISSPTPLEFGAWGNVARCTVDAINLPLVHFELPSLTDQATLYGDKTMVFTKTDNITLDVP
jgi:PKD repeat protein